MNPDPNMPPGSVPGIGSRPRGREPGTDARNDPVPAVPGTDAEPMGTDGRLDAPARVLEALTARGPSLAYELAEALGLAVALVDHRLRELLRAGRVARSPGPDGRWRWRLAP